MSSWSKLISLCQNNDGLEFALGIHPYFISSATEDDLQTLSDLVQKHRQSVVAVGEIGLDFASAENNPKQIEFFEQQLSIANNYNLPVIIHHRKSHNELIRILKNTPVNKGGVVHAFSGSMFEAKTYIGLGFKIGVGGTITYQRAGKTRDVIRQLPIESLLLETDAPDMPIYGRQGQRNSPAFLPEILQSL
jgi:TatD DNase family protein